MRRLHALVAIAALGCGQTSRDADPGSSGGTGGALPVECSGSHWTRFGPPPGATPRFYHVAAAWRSDQVIIWGGDTVNTGWRVFSDGSVAPLPVIDAPSIRNEEAFDIFDNRLLIWGGSTFGGIIIDDGASLDLETDRWAALPSPGGLLGARTGALSGVIGQLWLVWGGDSSDFGFTSGAFYEPIKNVWAAVGEDAPALSFRGAGTALGWGGPEFGPAVFGGSHPETESLGYLYASKSESWWKMPDEGAPSPRAAATLTWSPTTQEFIVWGGAHTGALRDGARLSMLSGTWTPMSVAGAPSARSGHQAVMLGSKLVVFGGRESAVDVVATGGIYDVATDTWEALPLDECAPPPRSAYTFTAFGDGKHALLWGSGYSPVDPDDKPLEQGWLFTL